MPNIKLQSSDGDVFEVDIQVAKCSGIIRTMLNDCKSEEASNAPIPLYNVNSNILQKVILWANHHKDDPAPRKGEYLGDISSWDAQFLNVDHNTLFQLILAANYLDIKGLLDVTCQTVANMMRDKTAEEVRQIFDIKRDL